MGEAIFLIIPGIKRLSQGGLWIWWQHGLWTETLSRKEGWERRKEEKWDPEERRNLSPKLSGKLSQNIFSDDQPNHGIVKVRGTVFHVNMKIHGCELGDQGAISLMNWGSYLHVQSGWCHSEQDHPENATVLSLPKLPPQPPLAEAVCRCTRVRLGLPSQVSESQLQLLLF